MSSISDFKAAFKEFDRRTLYKAEYDFRKKFTDETLFRSATSCVSIGPADGNKDAQIVHDLLPSLKKYIAVEREAALLGPLCTTMGQALQGRPGIQSTYIIADAEDWDGPDETVDVVLLLQVMYYFQEPAKFLKKCKSWLAPGGFLVITESDGEMYAQMKKYLKVDVRTIMHPVPVKQLIENMDFTCVKVFPSKEPIDLSNPNQDFVNFLLDREATAEEMKAFQTLVDNEYKSEGFVINLGVQVFLCMN